MYQLYPTITTTELRDNPSTVYKRASESPVVVMSRATPKVVCVSPDEWNKIAQLVEDQEDIIAALKVELAIALGEESVEEITDFDAFRMTNGKSASLLSKATPSQATTSETQGDPFLLSIAGIGSSSEHDLSERDEEILANEIDPIYGWTTKQGDIVVK